MIVSKSDYDKTKYKFKESIFEVYVITTSIKFDLDNFVKNVQAKYLDEYDLLLQEGYQELIKKVQKRNFDGFYNMEFKIQPMYSSVIVLYMTCDGVVKI